MPRETPLRRLIQDLDIQLPSSSKASEESDGSSSGSDDENSPSDAEGSEVGGEENQDAEQEEQAGQVANIWLIPSFLVKKSLNFHLALA